MWPVLTPSHWLSLHGLFTVAGLLVYIVASHVLQQRRHPSAAIGWVLSMLLLPYAALPLYSVVSHSIALMVRRLSPPTPDVASPLTQTLA